MVKKFSKLSKCHKSLKKAFETVLGKKNGYPCNFDEKYTHVVEIHNFHDFSTEKKLMCLQNEEKKSSNSFFF